MSPEPSQLALGDREDVTDLETFLGRARTLDPDGAVRIEAVGPAAAFTVCVVPGHGLLGDGTVLGMRAWRLADPARLDTVVAVEALRDRLARMRRDGGLTLGVPPAELRVAWAAQAPPRTGWTALGEIAADDLVERAAAGVREIAEGAPEGSGAQAVADLRRRVWSRSLGLEAWPDAPAGLAFGARALGFTGPGRLLAHGRWWRLATRQGYVLAR